MPSYGQQSPPKKRQRTIIEYAGKKMMESQEGLQSTEIPGTQKDGAGSGQSSKERPVQLSMRMEMDEPSTSTDKAQQSQARPPPDKEAQNQQ